MFNRLIKVGFTSVAVLLLSAPAALNAQTTQAKWSGVHVGVLGGAAAGTFRLHEADGTPGDTEDLDVSMEGARLGVQGGVDFNVKGLVLGAVADWSWSAVKTKLDISEGGVFQGNALDAKVKQMTTVRARAGHAYGRVLPYVHGGLLVATTQLGGGSGSFANNANSVSKVHNGFVVGGGLEYALSHHYSFTTEYAYNHVSGVDVTAAIGLPAGDLATLNSHFSTLNVGFNYRF